MFYKGLVVVLAMVGLAGSTASSFAMSGLGCPDLPEYYRAVGTIENGPAYCGMSLEQAKQILAHQRGPGDSPQYPTVTPNSK